ncbi:MAG: preprotein translocase subunit SecG [Clostridia bacterium]|nr:preprotein translocase subunit SecG [Clostridia bacterium]
MSLLEIILGVVLIILAVAVTAVVLFQEGQQRPMGAITGASSDTFLTKNKQRSIDAFLERWTRNIAISFFTVVVAVNVLLYFRFV